MALPQNIHQPNLCHPAISTQLHPPLPAGDTMTACTFQFHFQKRLLDSKWAAVYSAISCC